MMIELWVSFLTADVTFAMLLFLYFSVAFADVLLGFWLWD